MYKTTKLHELITEINNCNWDDKEDIEKIKTVRWAESELKDCEATIAAQAETITKLIEALKATDLEHRALRHDGWYETDCKVCSSNRALLEATK